MTAPLGRPAENNLLPCARKEVRMEAIPDYDIEALARALLPAVQAYYNSPEGQAAFAKWKEQQATEKDKPDT